MAHACSICGKFKDTSDFSLSNKTRCRVCVNRLDREKYRENLEASRASSRKKMSAYRKRDPERWKTLKRSLYQKNRGVVPSKPSTPHSRALSAQRTRRRNAAKLNAVPRWANEFFIREAYQLALRRTRITGFKWSVDHIVPLRGKMVCGLHCEANLAVIPMIDNERKGNRHWPGN